MNNTFPLNVKRLSTDGTQEKMNSPTSNEEEQPYISNKHSTLKGLYSPPQISGQQVFEVK
jgi:hypothetical protein